jgi:hypothetical protein
MGANATIKQPGASYIAADSNTADLAMIWSVVQRFVLQNQNECSTDSTQHYSIKRVAPWQHKQVELQNRRPAKRPPARQHTSKPSTTGKAGNEVVDRALAISLSSDSCEIWSRAATRSTARAPRSTARQQVPRKEASL